jgi:hypothetical protein
MPGHHPPQSGQRLPAGGLDGGQGVARLVGTGVEDTAARVCLDRDDADAVRHHVVQLAGGSRSASSVWVAAWVRRSSARVCACRIECPISQAMIAMTSTTITALTTLECTATMATAPPSVTASAASGQRRSRSAEASRVRASP